jgi:hypothetical protein
MQLFICDLCGMAELVVKTPEKNKELMSKISDLNVSPNGRKGNSDCGGVA